MANGWCVFMILVIGISPAAADPHVSSPDQHTATAAGGTLVGRIVYDGEPPAPELLAIPLVRSYYSGGQWRETREIPSHREAFDAGLTDQTLLVDKEGGIANAVIWVRSRNVPAPEKPAELAAAMMEFRDHQLSPHVLVFWNAAPLRFKNNAPEAVNFNLASIHDQANRLVLPGGEIVFDQRRAQPLPSRVTSNVQPWLSAYMMPLSHPYFAVTDEEGRFKIENLPPGEWVFRVWHERSGWLDTERTPKGRFKLKVGGDEIDLGELRVNPSEFAR